MMQTFAGYDPASPTLVGPERSQGDCLGPDWPGGRSLIWWDSAAPIYSGDAAVIALAPPGHPISLAAKILQCTRAGRWFGVCDTGALPLDRVYCIGVAAIVAREVLPTPMWRVDADPPSPEGRQVIAELSADARAEWARFGYPPRTRFPGLTLDAETQAAAWGIVCEHTAHARSAFALPQAGHA